MIGWLIDNAAAIQALTGVFTAVLAGPTLLYLIKAYGAASQQAEAADRQAIAAEAATASANDAAQAAREQSDLLRRAEEAKLFPFLVVVDLTSNGFPRYVVQNQGEGTAFEIQFEQEVTPTQFRLAQSTIGPSYTSPLRIPQMFSGGNFGLIYQGADRRKYSTRVRIAGDTIQQDWFPIEGSTTIHRDCS